MSRSRSPEPELGPELGPEPDTAAEAEPEPGTAAPEATTGPGTLDRDPDARTTAACAPTRTRASGGAPRNDSNVANHPTASNRLVLPCPLPPLMTVSPDGAKVTEAVA